MKTFSGSLRICRVLVAMLFGAACSPNIVAHEPGLSTVLVHCRPERFDVVLVLAVKDAGELVDLDGNDDGQTTRLELAAAEKALVAGAGEAVKITCRDQPATFISAQCTFDDNNNVNLNLRFAGAGAGRFEFRSRWLDRLPSGHRQFLTIHNAQGDLLIQRLLSVSEDSAATELSGVHAAAGGHVPSQSVMNFLLLGVKHILMGYDHLLFLFSLLIVTRSLMTALQVITCFTLAHSITLALAAFDLVRIPGHIVEPVIAASIVVVAVENVVRGQSSKGRLLLVGIFGLIHGLGFASVLRELGVGDSGKGVIMPLLSFNLGVELGQLLIAAPFLALLGLLRQSPVFVRRWVPACSVVAALAGIFWLVQRVCFDA